MVWQDAVSPTGGPAFDADGERERRLAAQARAGAEWALTALIARYQPTVVRYLTRLCGNPAQARTLAERIFQRMERRLHGPHGTDNLRLWLLRASTEAGLDALRHPQSAPAPRLMGNEVAGLLTEESGAEAPGFLRGGLHRLRRASGAVNRQARPLVWSDDVASAANSADSAQDVTHSATESHLDETLDHLDPRDALRHRLVRVTLAELPYGDAQCLALHLVAGLNQAEVAKALGITNSAARKRMVHGLALFSDRYSQAVQSLGLPVELGFGDALPRSPIEPEPVEHGAHGEDRLVEVNTAPDRSRDTLSGVSYVTEDTSETIAIVPDDLAQSESLYEERYVQADGDDLGDLSGVAGASAFDAATAHAYHSVAVEIDDTETQVDDGLVAAYDPAPVSGGLITRVAADAIIGPVVDALPISSAAPALPEGYGQMGQRSMPLAYELSSNVAHEPQGITMNLLDGAGQMTPLTFESVAVNTGSLTAPDEGEALTFETVALPVAPMMPPDEPAAAEGETLGYELAQAGADDSAEAAPSEAEPSEAQESILESILEPIIVPVLSAPADQPAASANSLSDETQFGALQASGAITRSLEAVWDELPDGVDL